MKVELKVTLKSKKEGLFSAGVYDSNDPGGIPNVIMEEVRADASTVHVIEQDNPELVQAPKGDSEFMSSEPEPVETPAPMENIIEKPKTETEKKPDEKGGTKTPKKAPKKKLIKKKTSAKK